MVPSIFTFSWEYTACRKETNAHTNPCIEGKPKRSLCHARPLINKPRWYQLILATSLSLYFLQRYVCITCMFSSWYSKSVLSVLSMSVWSRASCSPWVRRKMWLFWRSICCCSFPCCEHWWTNTNIQRAVWTGILLTVEQQFKFFKVYIYISTLTDHVSLFTSSISLCFSSLSVSSFCCKLRAFISSMACFFSRSLSCEDV